MSVEEQVKHCIENSSVSNDWDYTIEESEDNENTVILHAHPSFLTPELTEELRNRLIFVDATSSSYTKEHSTMYFLHYLEPEEDTFMDELANPVSTEHDTDVEELDERFSKINDIIEGRTKKLSESWITEEDLISEEEIKEVEERLEGSALDLFQRLVDNALKREKFYKIFNEEKMSTDHYRIREVLQDIGGYRVMDIRMSKKVRKHAEGDSSE